MTVTEVEAHPSDFYDRSVDLYVDFVTGELEHRPLERAWLRILVDHVLKVSQEGGPNRLFDLGCGPGLIAAELRAIGPDLDLVCLDGAPGMIRRLVSDLAGVAPLVGDLRQLPLGSESAIGVLSRYSAIHTPVAELPQLLSETVRVLRPGGYLLIQFFGARNREGHGEPFDHKAAMAYRFDIDVIAELLGANGCIEMARSTRRHYPEERPIDHESLFVQRSS